MFQTLPRLRAVCQRVAKRPGTFEYRLFGSSFRSRRHYSYAAASAIATTRVGQHLCLSLGRRRARFLRLLALGYLSPSVDSLRLKRSPCSGCGRFA